MHHHKWKDNIDIQNNQHKIIGGLLPTKSPIELKNNSNIGEKTEKYSNRYYEEQWRHQNSWVQPHRKK